MVQLCVPGVKQMLFSSVLVPSTAYPDVALEEEVEETEHQQNSGRGDSGVKSPIDRTDSMLLKTSAHITVPLVFKHMQQKGQKVYFTLNKSSFI